MIKKLLVLLIIPVALVTGCKGRRPADTKPVVTVTILPFSYFVHQLAGDHFRINVLVPPGASHHNYDPSPRQLQDLEKSKALFIDGYLGFEKPWIPKMRANYRNLSIIDLSKGINLISVEGGEGEHEEDEEHQGVDPHYWMSVIEAKKIASTMAKGLIRADPSCGQLVEGNLGILTKRLDSLEGSMARILGKLSHRSFLIFHPALTYLARDYDLSQYSMEHGGKEPAASHFRELVKLSEAGKINTIFIQKEYDQENALTLAREIGAKIVVIDPMSPDWFGEMKELIRKLAGMDETEGAK